MKEIYLIFKEAYLGRFVQDIDFDLIFSFDFFAFFFKFYFFLLLLFFAANYSILRTLTSPVFSSIEKYFLLTLFSFFFLFELCMIWILADPVNSFRQDYFKREFLTKLTEAQLKQSDAELYKAEMNENKIVAEDFFKPKMSKFHSTVKLLMEYKKDDFLNQNKSSH